MIPTPASFDQLALSVVSHGQGQLVRFLLDDLQPLLEQGVHLIVTLNIPEDETYLVDYRDRIDVVRNKTPRGFGANHNQAFQRASKAQAFAVVNPDIRLNPYSVLPSLLKRLSTVQVGAVAPRVHGPDGLLQDSVRRFPTPFRIATRVLKRLAGRPNSPDYDLSRGIQSVDWAAGMFVLFSSTAFHSVRGFDERFFMYLEDADVCRRLRQHGWQTLIDVEVNVIHDARRASGRSLKHLAWHIDSLFRFFATRTR